MFTLRFAAAFAIAGAIGTASWAQPANQNPPPGCRAWDADLPAEWAPWGQEAVEIDAAAVESGASKAVIPYGRKAAVTLAPAGSVHMIVETPDVDPPPNAHEGILWLHVPQDGYYWIASSQGLWIDVVADHKILDSTDHGPGPHCASIGKSVQFLLKAGDVAIQLSDNRGPRVDIMVARQP